MKSILVLKQVLVIKAHELFILFLWIFLYGQDHCGDGSLCGIAGELKKMLAAPTGLHPQDQKLLYKDKERDSKLFLDIAGVKGGSKLVLIEDELSRERRCLESRKNAKMEKAAKEISAIRVEVDKLAKQVGILAAFHPLLFNCC